MFPTLESYFHYETEKLSAALKEFKLLNEYYVLFDEGAFKDLSGNDVAGISDSSEWNFTVSWQGHIVKNAFWSDEYVQITARIRTDPDQMFQHIRLDCPSSPAQSEY